MASVNADVSLQSKKVSRTSASHLNDFSSLKTTEPENIEPADTKPENTKIILESGLDNIFSCLRAKFKMCLQKHILFRFCDLNIVKMSVF
jgi:hypothetical protein